MMKQDCGSESYSHHYAVEGLSVVEFTWHGKQITATDETGMKYEGTIEHPMITDGSVIKCAFEGSQPQALVIERCTFKEGKIELRFGFPIFKTATSFYLLKEEQSLTHQIESLKKIVLQQKQEIRELKLNLSKGRAEKVWGLAGQYTAPSTWADLPNASLTLMVLNDNANVKMSCNLSCHSSASYGGIRIVMDKELQSQKIWGTQETYGMLWASAHPNAWTHLRMDEILGGVPAGQHTFIIQVQSTGGGTLQVNVGDDGETYSRIYFKLKEL